MPDPVPPFTPPSGRLCWSGCVGSGDIDENGHMNVQAYDRVMEQADMAFFLTMGWAPDYARKARRGFFRVEKHIRYQSELLEGAAIAVSLWLGGHEARKFHLFFQLWDIDAGHRAATMETMVLHMDLRSRRPTDLLDPVQRAAWRALSEEQAGQSEPEGMGRAVAMTRRGARRD